MNRKIELRTWLKLENKMGVIGSFYPVSKRIILQNEKRNYGFKFYEDNEYVLMQYTGIKDKNGKEIYEGDIVQFCWFNQRQEETHITSVIKFAEGMWQIWTKINTPFFGLDEAYSLYNGAEQDDEIEVIGNIYENPELITKKEKN